MAGPNGEPVLVIRNLEYSYREGGRRRAVLRGLDLTVWRGECVAVLGRSGSGKSTLLNLISGIDRPQRGEILVAGRDLTRMNERSRTLVRRHQIGFVYQLFNLLATLTVEENLRLPLELTRGDPARAREWLQAVELEERRDAFPEHLSGGEQQRVAIARALVHDPLLVLADEPTGNLDAATGERIIRLLDRLVRGGGKTLILVTHSRAVAGLADRTLVLEDGRLVPGREGIVW